jgi:hypothetical protein
MQLGVSPWPVDVISLPLPPALLALPEADDADPADTAEPDDDCGELDDDADALPLTLQPVRERTIIPPPQAKAAVARRRLSSIDKTS